MRSSDLGLGVKGLSSQAIAGSHRDVPQYSLGRVRQRGRVQIGYVGA